MKICKNWLSAVCILRYRIFRSSLRNCKFSLISKGYTHISIDPLIDLILFWEIRRIQLPSKHFHIPDLQYLMDRNDNLTLTWTLSPSICFRFCYNLLLKYPIDIKHIFSYAIHSYALAVIGIIFSCQTKMLMPLFRMRASSVPLCLFRRFHFDIYFLNH